MSDSHDTSSHSHEAAHSGSSLSSKTGFISSFWFVVILIGLFIAALNFINVMGHEEHGAGHSTPATHEASAGSTLSGETGLGLPVADTTQHADTVRHEAVSAPAH